MEGKRIELLDLFSNSIKLILINSTNPQKGFSITEVALVFWENDFSDPIYKVVIQLSHRIHPSIFFSSLKMWGLGTPPLPSNFPFLNLE